MRKCLSSVLALYAAMNGGESAVRLQSDSFLVVCIIKFNGVEAGGGVSQVGGEKRLRPFRDSGHQLRQVYLDGKIHEGE